MIKIVVLRKEMANGRISYYSPITSTFNGQKTTAYLLINFKKGIEVKENCVIELKKFWFSSYPSKNGARVKIVITEYEKLESRDKEVYNEYNNERQEYADLGY